jgi:glucokinase
MAKLAVTGSCGNESILEAMGENQMQSNYILTADIGGSHITVGVCEVDTLQLKRETITRGEVDSKGTAGEIFAAWAEACGEVMRKAAGLPISGLSVAMPGPFDYQHGIAYIKGLNKYETLYGMDIRQYFAELLKLAPGMVRFRNDAESAIAGEVLMGAGKGYKKVIGVTLGTGFGSAFSNDKITQDINLGSAAYKETIADDYLSTRWFLKRYSELTGISLAGGVRELAQLAETSDVARNVFKEFVVNMCDFLSSPIAHYSPDALIVCGNIAKASALFLPSLARLLSPLPVVPGVLNENASLVGAAAMFKNGAGSAMSSAVTQ